MKARFDSQASDYDSHAQIQRRVADSLLKSKDLPTSAKRILDLGCGTGYLATCLAKIYPEAQIDALDISSEMLAQLKQKNADITTICTSAEDWQSEQKYDLIISSLAFQWFEDPCRIAERYTSFLAPKGTLLFNILTDKTLASFRRAFAQENLQYPGLNYLSEEQLQLSLPHNAFSYEAQMIEINFPSVQDFLRQMHKIGAVSNQTPMNTGDLRRVIRQLITQKDGSFSDCYHFLEVTFKT